MLISIDSLEATAIRLVPLQPDMKASMRLALDCDPEGWSVLSVTAHGDGFEPFWDQMLAEHQSGTRIAYAIVRTADDRIVGTSSFLDIRVKDCAVEIGATFLHPDVRAGLTNPQAKYLMLDHAFKSGAIRVGFTVDRRNLRSQAAVGKLGAVREGVLRQHKITWTGYVRDSVVFSILDKEWPQVRGQLLARIAGP